MLTEFVQYLALGATIIVAVGYVPQITHLWKEHCSAGISITAWSVWVLASLLFYSHAITIRDPVFMTLLTVQFFAQIVIVLLSMRYRGLACAYHGGHSHAHEHSMDEATHPATTEVPGAVEK